MNLFWRDTPLTQDEQALVAALADAHYKSAFRANPSSIAVQCAASGSGDLCHSVAAGLSTLGIRHGPVAQTCAFLRSRRSAGELVDEFLANGLKIPGWGSSFAKAGAADPFWEPVEEALRTRFSDKVARLDEVTEALYARDLILSPNPSAYTAMTAIILGMPDVIAPLLLIYGRLEAWTEIFLAQMKDE